MTFTHINESVLEFYKELPFNYRDSIEEHALSVMRKTRWAGTAYEMISPMLKSRANILEVGCGAGWLSNRVAYHNRCNVTGIDFNPVAIERARMVSEYIGRKVNFEVADLFEYEMKPADLIISLGVLHHTGNFKGALEKICQSTDGSIFIGLYHKYGRKPFLDEFANIESEVAKFKRYCELDTRFNDKTHLLSWFRDQVLHPHETQHTMEEVNEILKDNNMKVIWSSIEGDEKLCEDVGRKKLLNNEYWPGFFTFLARKI